MDAAFFRFLGPELVEALSGVRFDTVFSPTPGFWTLAFTPPVRIAPDAVADCRFLLARVHSREGVLFLSPVKPANPPKPSARVMWLRKRLRGRKIQGGVSDWPHKRLALELSTGEGRYLLITMEDDPVVLERLPEGFGEVPVWGAPDEASADPACPRSLRAALGREEALSRPSFFESFLYGRSTGFYLSDSGEKKESPLPWTRGGVSERYGSALEAAQAYGQTAYFAALAPREIEPRRALARQRKRLSLLDRDQLRLEALEGQQIYAEAVAANLSGLSPRERLGPRVLEHPEQGPLEVPLDPALTVLENMERFFRKAAKGRRGLGHVERLRKAAEEGALAPARSASRMQAEPQKAASRGAGGHSRSKGRDIALHRFRSSDGFVILRGKNSAANHKLLSEMASPFDFWFHAEGGPGAHVILKRDHPGQDVPESSLKEAAGLAGLSSWRAADAKAVVLVAQCSEVRKIKGAAQGQVRLDSAKTMLVELDPSMEDRLRLG
jgi:hypothetical protein